MPGLEDKLSFLLKDTNETLENGAVNSTIINKLQYLMNKSDNDLRPKFEFLMRLNDIPSNFNGNPTNTYYPTSNFYPNNTYYPTTNGYNQTGNREVLSPLAPINKDCNDPNNPDILAYMWTTDEKGTTRECITADDFSNK
jgi:hypothetical protein